VADALRATVAVPVLVEAVGPGIIVAYMAPVVRQFAQILDDHLKQIGLTPITAAEKFGLNRDAIRSVMRGRTPSIERVYEICDAVGLECYIGPPRAVSDVAVLPPESDSHRWGQRRGEILTPYPVPMRDGHQPEWVGFSPNGCVSFGLEFLLEFNLNPLKCEVIEFFDDSMAPGIPVGAVGLVDLRRTRRRHDHVFVIEAPELTVRRLRKCGSEWQVVADNPEFEAVSWAPDFSIVGRVVWTSHMVGMQIVR